METLFFQSKQGTNPFKDEPLPTAHYHPSLRRDLTDTERQVNLSPKRSPKHDALGKTSLEGGRALPDGKPSPAERDFLGGANTMLAKELPTHDTPSPGNASSRFDESWPASERPSTVDSPREYGPPCPEASSWRPGTSEGTGMHKEPSGSSSSTTGTDYLAQWRNRYNKKEGRPHPDQPAEGSTLAKYIQRFRYSEPKSRQERDRDKHAHGSRDFWWLAPPSQTSTPTDDGARIAARRPEMAGSARGGRGGGGRGGGGSAGRRGSGGSYDRSTSSVSPRERTDTDTDDLQARAERLLERSESTILSEPAISSDGVGFSPTSSDYQEPDISGGVTPAPVPAAQDSFHVSPPMRPLRQPTQRLAPRPQDDILHQWRVRRRLEEARKQSIRRGPSTAGSRGTGLEEQLGGSRLEDFRKRLQQQQLLSQARSGVLPLPPDPPTKTIGTSPIPQTIATQTNGVLPSVDEDAPVRDEPRPGQVTHEGAVGEPVRPHVHKLRDICARPAAAEKPIVASPSIRQMPSQPVPPHLHMACDIIPCPPDWRSSASQKDLPERTEERITPLGDVRERTAEDGGRGSSVTRQPDAQQLAPSREGHPPGDSGPSGRQHPQENTDLWYPNLRPGASRNSHLTRGSEEMHRHRTRPEGGGIPDHALRQRLDFRQEEPGPQGGSEGAQDRRRRRQPVESVKEQEEGEMRDLDEEVVKEEAGGGNAGGRTPTRMSAKSSHAYAPSPVGAAVGQVISDRLFTTPRAPSITSPQSSIDSLPSMHSSLKSHRSDASILAPDEGRRDSQDGASASDGEEFAEDELLQLLRQRQARYEGQLQVLDRLLSART